MALDVAVIDVDGAPDRWISVEPRDHRNLILKAGRLDLPMTLRLREYRRCALLRAAEVDAFLDELDVLESRGAPDGSLAAVLFRLRVLGLEAMRRRTGIAALAD